MTQSYYTYIVAGRSHTLCIGFTGDIERRMRQHKNKVFEGFSSKYNCNRLVLLEEYNSAGTAIAREKHLKGWLRSRKIELKEEANPTWIDLSEN